jgi:branched-chain amino acid transport system substrate-binding protein
MKRLVLPMLSVCFVVLLLASFVVVYAQGKEEPIRIGVLTDHSGFMAEYGPKFRVLQDLYLGEIGYKVAGKPIKIFSEDSASTPATALEKARKLVGVDKVHILIGTIQGTISFTVAPFAAEAKVPHILWGAGHYELIEKGWTYATQPPLEVASYIAGKYAYDKGYRTAISIGQDYVAGHKYQGGAIQGFIDKGGKVIQKQWVPLTGTVDYAPYLSAMKQADVCFFFLAGVNAVTFWKQYNDFGLLDKMPLVMTEGDMIFEAFLEKERVDPRYAGRISGRTTYTADIDNPSNKKFLAAFRGKTGMEPDAFDVGAYETCMLAVSAFERTKGDTNPEKLRQAIRGITINTPASVVRISPEGYAFRTTYTFELAQKGGKLIRKRTGAYPEQELIRLRPGIVP